MEMWEGVKFVLTILGGGAVVALAIAGFVYWLLQKAIDARFAKALVDYQHSRNSTLQNERLRLDLYDRRFKLYSGIFDFYYAMISWEGTLEQKEARQRFFMAYQESAFLFTKESGIEELLKMLNSEAAKVIGFKENSELYKSDPAFLNEQFLETNRIQLTVFEDGLAKFKEAIRPYLDFSKI
ncbi:hypothetical protein [Rhizobium sp. IMFF44]|uniref:hypothetical protein n=1 Tax=Rhizobium sp. IMFF44 TaxID=3342350 RepID=UPI0035B84D27